jgi:nitrate/nitrite-specific signal transduction histidine kinase
MKKGILLVIALGVVVFRSSPAAWGEEVPYTLEDRDRLIRIEVSLREFKESVDKRFEQVDKRLEEFRESVDKRFEQVDKRLEEFRESVDKRFEQVDRRFEQMMTFMWILASVFSGLVAVTIGFAVWDRKTALAPALRRSREVEERVERVLRELAQEDPKVAEALRHAGFL